MIHLSGMGTESVVNHSKIVKAMLQAFVNGRDKVAGVQAVNEIGCNPTALVALMNLTCILRE